MADASVRAGRKRGADPASVARSSSARSRTPNAASQQIATASEPPSASATSVSTGNAGPPARCSSTRAAELGAIAYAMLRARRTTSVAATIQESGFAARPVIAPPA